MLLCKQDNISEMCITVARTHVICGAVTKLCHNAMSLRILTMALEACKG